MAEQLPAADIFTRISDPAEKSRFFIDLAKSRSEIIAKVPEPSAEILVLTAAEYHDPKLVCKIAGATSQLPPTGELILTFFIGGEKYFFQANYKVQGQQLSLLCLGPLFHLQRREDYRIKIPKSYQALFEIVAVNGKTDKKSIPLMDLSGGGCRIQVDPKVLPLKSPDLLKGHLYLPDRKPIPVAGSIRHTRMDSEGQSSMVCGIQFVDLGEPVKNKIVAVVMDLYRELFAGRNN